MTRHGQNEMAELADQSQSFSPQDLLADLLADWSEQSGAGENPAESAPSGELAQPARASEQVEGEQRVAEPQGVIPPPLEDRVDKPAWDQGVAESADALGLAGANWADLDPWQQWLDPPRDESKAGLAREGPLQADAEEEILAPALEPTGTVAPERTGVEGAGAGPGTPARLPPAVAETLAAAVAEALTAGVEPALAAEPTEGSGAEEAGAGTPAALPPAVAETLAAAVAEALAGGGELALAAEPTGSVQPEETREIVSEAPGPEVEQADAEGVHLEDQHPTPLTHHPAVDAEGVDLEGLIAAIDGQVEISPLDPQFLPQRAEAQQDFGGRHHDHIVFTLAGVRYGVGIEQILELDKVPPITPVPGLPEFVRGVANLRGDIIAVLDLRAVVGLAPGGDLRQKRMLVVRHGQEEANCGLIVDAVEGIAPVALARLHQLTGPLQDQVAPLLSGVYEHEQQLLNILDLDRLFASPELQQLEAT